jgi:pyridoxal phosphate enzyme (YggS family)
MHQNLNNLVSIQSLLKDKLKNDQLPTIIAVSKKFKKKEILPLINYGHKHFGENQVQEALEKWIDIKNDFKDIRLHMIGKLQSNKVKYAIRLFDYIHSVDNLKLAEKIANEQIKSEKNIKVFIQVNIGNEDQKNGINVENLHEFYEKCKNELKLDVIGLMCLPPLNSIDDNYFLKMRQLSDNLNLPELSMGMSNDYQDALEHGSTYIRVGSKIFGERPK